MFNLFKSKKKELLAPTTGQIIPLDQVEDRVFAEKMMGDGFAIMPDDGKIISPCNGQIVNLFKTKHALIIRDEYGLEIIIHVGLDTVKLKGEGYSIAVELNQEVKKGALLMEVDLETIQKEGYSTVTPVVVTNMAKIKSFEINEGTAEAGDVVMTFETK